LSSLPHNKISSAQKTIQLKIFPVAWWKNVECRFTVIYMMPRKYPHPRQSVYNRISRLVAQFQPDSKEDLQLRSQIMAMAQHGTKTTISSHILDTHLGIPGRGIHLKLQMQDAAGKWVTLKEAQTNEDGRVVTKDFPELPGPGIYRIVFYLEDYYTKLGVKKYFYPKISVLFQITPEGTGQHYHIPLLLSPFGYSTYRGS
jgi:5-hydroxyisourate hydrolase